MVDFKSRRHRLELPSIPSSDDPAVLKKAMDQMKRLVQDEFNRLSTDFYDFKQATYNAAVIPLRGVSNIEITKDQYGMSATWELPDGDEITPTHVRVRILEISPNSWALYSYPKTSWEFNGLTPGTQYTLQVQLVATFEATDTFVSTTRNCPSVPVLRTAESDIKAKVFTTNAGVGPPTNGGTNNANYTFNFPNTQGIPGTVGSANCWWEYKIQYRAACAWVDTGAGGASVNGNVGNVVINTAAAPYTTYPNAAFRIAHREICNSVPQAWKYANEFMAGTYANANCMGIIKSASFTDTPFSTATLFALPGVCQSSGSSLKIVNTLTNAQFLPQEPGFKCIEYIDNEWTLLADDTANTAISNTIFQGLLAGTVAAIASFNAETDFTLGFEIKVPSNALVLAGGTGPYTIIDIGGKIKAQLIENTASFSLQIQVPRDGGGAYTFRADGLTYNTWISFFYVHDVELPNGRVLYVNGAEVARSANAIANDFTGITGDIQINTVNNMQIRKIYGWNVAVVPDVPPVGQGLVAGGGNTGRRADLQVFAIATNTWSTSSSVLPAGVASPGAICATGTYQWTFGGQNTSAINTDTVTRWAWSTSVSSSASVLPSGGSLGGGGINNPSVAGYKSNDEQTSDFIRKMVYATEVWSSTGQTSVLSTFPIGVASNWGVNGYLFGYNGAIASYQRFPYATETLANITGGFKPNAYFRPQGMSNQGVAMYSAGGNFLNTVEKVFYATDTGAATALGGILPAVRIGSRNAIENSPTNGFMAGGDNSGTASSVVYAIAFATDTASTSGSMNTPISGGACGSGT